MSNSAYAPANRLAGAGHVAVPGRAFAFAVWVLGAAVFLASYTTWRVHFDYLFTISDALFCLAALFLFSGGRANILPFGGLTILWYGGLLFMLVALLISSLVHGSGERWLIVAAQYAFAFGLLPMLLVHNIGRVTQRLVLALVFGVVAMELFGAIIYFVTEHDYKTAQMFGYEFITGNNRLGAFTADANWNAAVIAMTLPFAFYLGRIGRLGTLGISICTGILGIGLLLTGSVTGFASAVISSAIFVMVAGERRIVRASVLIATIVGVLVAMGAVKSLPDAFQRRVAAAIESGDVSTAGTYVGRRALIEEAWGMTDRTALVGIGVDQYRVDSADHMPVHNMYLLIWTEGGVFALIGWLMMMTLPIILSLYCIGRDRGTAGLGLAVTFVFIAFSMASPHMYSRSWTVPLIIAMAVMVSQLASRPRSKMA
jgi:O-antigen ligase